MEARLMNHLKNMLLFILLLSSGSCQNDLFLEFCGTWRHGRNPMSLNINLSTGCSGVYVSANESSLSVIGKITSQCTNFDVIPLNKYGLESEEDSDFCLHWQPLLDQLTLQIGGENIILCSPASPGNSCCTDLTHGSNDPEATYGIVNAKIRNDLVTDKTVAGYNFEGRHANCKLLCEQQVDRSSYMMRYQNSELPCSRKYELDLDNKSSGSSFQSENTPYVFIPPDVKPTAKVSKAAITFHKNNSVFQEGYDEVRLLNDVVEITVENEIITGLSDPIKICFKHDAIAKNHARTCVSWDTRRDPWQVKWVRDGCETRIRGDEDTECLCNHLTYFTVLVQLQPRPVRHLQALTCITSVGCAVSFISAVALIVFFCRKKKRSKEQSIPIHLGLAVSLASLSLLFFFTGVLANVGGESVCKWVGALLHYSLLSSFIWMGVEVFHTFWLVHMVFRPSPKTCVWYLVGFGVPVVPVVVLSAVGGVYGLTEVAPAHDVSNPYLMCWMKWQDHKAFLAHCLTNLTTLAILVLSGMVMLFLVYREIRTRDEWKQNRVAFLSIWGLSCLFGTTWGLAFLDFGPLSDVILFLSCILNSSQGFLLMLRFCMLDWIRKQASGSVLGSTSSGSTRQHMLQTSEKS
nr:adhesion G-protein coupled receptor G1 [Nothobranchius furzeri]